MQSGITNDHDANPTPVEQEYDTHAPYRAPEKKSHLFLVLVIIVLVLLVVGGVTLLSRRTAYQTLASETEKMAVPSVQVIHPTVEPGQEDLVLPSTTQAYTESPIYARTNGYLKKWYHDIGSRVNQGRTSRRYRHARSRSAALASHAPNSAPRKQTKISRKSPPPVFRI